MLLVAMYRTYQIFLTMLKLDFFFFVAFGIQFLVLVLNPSDPEFSFTIIAIPVLVIVILFAVFGVGRMEVAGAHADGSFDVKMWW